MMFQHTRDPDPAWQEELDRLAPRSGQGNWLKIHWMAGWDYEPVQRWRIFEMVPNPGRFAGLAEFVDDLKGMSPRDPDNGKWITEGFQVLEEEGDTVAKRWCSWSNVDFDQWTLYQETQCYPVPVWIIQGENGGHRWRLSPSEIGILKDAGIEQPELPLPGDLPYAEYSKRTFDRLAEFDRLRKWKFNTSWDERMEKTHAGLWVRRERKLAEESYNAALLKHLEAQVETAVSDMSRSGLPGFSDMLPGDGHYNQDEDEVDQQFIEDTATTI